MPVLISAMLALQSVPASPTLAEVEASPPARAGELLLAGRAHREIVSVTRVEQPGPNPPGLVELDLIEAAQSEEGACLRRRWRAKFAHGPNQASSDARFDGAYPMREVALPGGTGCAGVAFAHVNPGIDVATATAALKQLRRVLTRPFGVEIVCSSRLDPPLCADKRATVARLSAEPVWGVLGEPGAIELMLGTPGQAPITVGLNPARPAQLVVSKEAPAPF